MSNEAAHYSVIRKIGEGSFAIVYQALHVLTDKKVAIKVVPLERLTPDYPLEKLYREISVMKLLRHPNIVKLFEVVQDETTVSIVIEYVPGGNLGDCMAAGPLTEDFARKIVRQTVSALQYCHCHSVVHRDLKPENILLDSSCNVKVADFGFSTQFRKGLMLTTACGTPSHAAPELFLGHSYVGPEVDLWSLGVILYTMISGLLPFSGQSVSDIRKSVLRGKYAQIPTATPECMNLINRLLIQEPPERISIEKLMLNKWVTKNGAERLLPYVNVKSMVLNTNQALHRTILKRMAALGYTNAEVQYELDQGRFSNASATYSLLEQEYLEAGTSLLTKQEDVERLLRERIRRFNEVEAVASASELPMVQETEGAAAKATKAGKLQPRSVSSTTSGFGRRDVLEMADLSLEDASRIKKEKERRTSKLFNFAKKSQLVIQVVGEKDALHPLGGGSPAPSPRAESSPKSDPAKQQAGFVLRQTVSVELDQVGESDPQAVDKHRDSPIRRLTNLISRQKSIATTDPPKPPKSSLTARSRSPSFKIKKGPIPIVTRENSADLERLSTEQGGPDLLKLSGLVAPRELDRPPKKGSIVVDDPTQIVQKLRTIFEDMAKNPIACFSFTQTGIYKFTCQVNPDNKEQAASWSIELCKIPNLEIYSILAIKNKGNDVVYEDVVKRLLKQFQNEK